jgi:peroxiredoxin
MQQDAATPARNPGSMARGPAVGETIPPFEAPDQHGRTQSLETIRGPNGALIAFVRSADW